MFESQQLQNKIVLKILRHKKRKTNTCIYTSHRYSSSQWCTRDLCLRPGPASSQASICIKLPEISKRLSCNFTELGMCLLFIRQLKPPQCKKWQGFSSFTSDYWTKLHRNQCNPLHFLQETLVVFHSTRF